MEDNLEPRKKKFKSDHPISSHETAFLITNLPQEILGEILQYLETETIYKITSTCFYYYKKINLWGLITKLDISSRIPISKVINAIDVNKLTKLERLDEALADRQNVSAALPRLTNLMSLNTKSMCWATSLIANLLPHYSLLRELTVPLDQAILSNFQGSFLTKLDASHCFNFDARIITHFQKLQVLSLSNNFLLDMSNTDTLTLLTCLTALTVTGNEAPNAELAALCHLTQLQYLEVTITRKILLAWVSKLHNLTTLKTSAFLSDWTDTLKPLTALQQLEIPFLITKSFTPQHCSNITHLGSYTFVTPRLMDHSQLFQLTALQNLSLFISYDLATNSKLSKLQRLTSLTLLQFQGAKVNLQSLFWTTLTHLARLKLPWQIDMELVDRTKQLMPSVDIVVPN